nr:zinc finger CCCH domain-containing protein 1 [Ipomoea batatas]
MLAGDKRRGGSGEGREAVAGGSGLDVSGCRLSGEKRRGPRGSFRWLCGEDRDAISGDFAERTERRSPVTMVWASHIWKSSSKTRDHSTSVDKATKGAILPVYVIYIILLPPMAEEPEKANSEDPQQTVCSFFRKPSKAKNIRKRTAAEEGENEDGYSKDETSVVFNKKKPTVADNKLHFSTGPSKREVTSESDAHSKKLLFQFESSREIQVQTDNKATATLETETEFSKDARAIRERVLKRAEEALKGKNESTVDEKLYKGIHGYTDYKAGFRREHTISSEKAGGSHGPLRASAHIRVSARFDYQPDICKDYKETGYCGYGDSCKFMHDRGDYKSG